jgi:hypothetical protein
MATYVIPRQQALAPPPITERDETRFWAKVDLPNEQGCMLWTAGCDRKGYGRFYLAGHEHGAHRVAYQLAYGPVPAGLVLDHVKAWGCTNRHCVAPDHLEPVTNRENLLRGEGFAAVQVRRTHCPAGHPYDEANTYRHSNGSRECLTCARASARRRASRRRAAGRAS